jgi:hypothetical protein
MIDKQDLMKNIFHADMQVCVTILEAGLFTAWREPESEMPEKLTADITSYYGDRRVRDGKVVLEQSGVISRRGSYLLPESVGMVSSLLNELLESMRLELLNASAGDFCEGFIDYLLSQGSGFSCSKDTDHSGMAVIMLDDKKYYFKIVFSPFCTPALADCFPDEEDSIITVGPFAAQAWERMYPYFGIPEYRDRVALFDPWNEQKLNLSRDNLGGYMDWYYRDRYKKHFSIPNSFADAIHDMGLMRYDDEY